MFKPPIQSTRFSAEEQSHLRDTAWAAIDYGLEHQAPLRPSLDKVGRLLIQPGASFVTLKVRSQLRGCIGSLEAKRPLLDDVACNAFAAAFSDPRFPPLSTDERIKLKMDISILTPAEAMHCESEADLLQQLVPGEDGLIIAEGGHRATFLPSVWESLPTPRSFVNHLKQKAGLPEDYWSPRLTVARYHTITV